MVVTSETLVREHIEYVSNHPHELRQFATIFEHMVHFFQSVWGMSERETNRLFEQFGSDIMSLQEIDLSGHPAYSLPFRHGSAGTGNTLHK